MRQQWQPPSSARRQRALLPAAPGQRQSQTLATAPARCQSLGGAARLALLPLLLPLLLLLAALPLVLTRPLRLPGGLWLQRQRALCRRPRPRRHPAQSWRSTGG
jgi:hypothetical protein